MWREGVLLAADGSQSSGQARGREAEKPLSPGLGTLLQWGSAASEGPGLSFKAQGVGRTRELSPS